MRRSLLSVVGLLGLLMAVSGVWSCAQTVNTELVKPKPPHVVSGGVQFTLHAPGAKQVALVGSFNGWAKGATPMKAMTGDLWSVVVPLNVGEHTFMYLVDDVQWVIPPAAEDFVTDGFGQANGVIVVR